LFYAARLRPAGAGGGWFKFNPRNQAILTFTRACRPAGPFFLRAWIASFNDFRERFKHPNW
ncbi:MAG: hypothetical protein ACRD59_02140, partial [Candidatus Acidiferrales bacterium]